jgi:CDP-paratose 2-epimerase
VLGVDNLVRPGSERNRASLKVLGVSVFHGDIRVPSDLEALPRVDWVVDAAANPSVLAGADGRSSSRQVVEHNLVGTINVLEKCKHDGAGIVILSTSRVYSLTDLTALPLKINNEGYEPATNALGIRGISREGVTESFSTAPPLSLYGSTKLASETLALEYGSAFDFPVWVNRCGVLAGAGQFGRADQGIFAFWINSFLRREPLTYLGFEGRGYQVRDCLHPRDVATLLWQQMHTPDKPVERTQIISGGIASAMSLAQLTAWCAARFGPRDVARDPRRRRFDIPWLVLDSSRAQEQWGWRPQTELNQILDEIAVHAEANPDWLEISAP